MTAREIAERLDDACAAFNQDRTLDHDPVARVLARADIERLRAELAEARRAERSKLVQSVAA